MVVQLVEHMVATGTHTKATVKFNKIDKVEQTWTKDNTWFCGAVRSVGEMKKYSGINRDLLGERGGCRGECKAGSTRQKCNRNASIVRPTCTGGCSQIGDHLCVRDVNYIPGQGLCRDDLDMKNPQRDKQYTGCGADKMLRRDRYQSQTGIFQYSSGNLPRSKHGRHSHANKNEKDRTKYDDIRCPSGVQHMLLVLGLQSSVGLYGAPGECRSKDSDIGRESESRGTVDKRMTGRTSGRGISNK